jgi:uncharacterized protein YlzI (FlbEa/FlbD family)
VSTKLVFQNGHEIVVLESHEDVTEILSAAYGEGYTTLRRDLGTGEAAITVNPNTIAYIEGLPELTQIGTVFG